MLPDIAFLVLVNLIGVFFEVSYRLLCVSRRSQTCYNNDLELIPLNAGILGVCYFVQFMQCWGSNGWALCMSVSNIPTEPQLQARTDPYLKCYAQPHHCPTKVPVPPAYLFFFFLSQNVPPVPLPVTAVTYCFLSYGVSPCPFFCHDHASRPSSEFSIPSLFEIHVAVCFSALVPRWLRAEERRNPDDCAGVVSSFSFILWAALWSP